MSAITGTRPRTADLRGEVPIVKPSSVKPKPSKGKSKPPQQPPPQPREPPQLVEEVVRNIQHYDPIPVGPFAVFYSKFMTKITNHVTGRHTNPDKPIQKKIWNNLLLRSKTETENDLKIKGITKKTISESFFSPKQKAEYQYFIVEE